MKGVLFSSVALAGALAFGVANASAEGLYIGGHAGLNIVPDQDFKADGITVDSEFDPGYAFGVAVGYKLPMGLRVEGEITHRKNDIDEVSALGMSEDVDGDFKTWAFMANAWYDFDTGTVWQPYLGGGIGAVRGELSAEDVDESDTVLGGQVGAGIGYRLTENVVVSADYRYMLTDDFSGGGNVDAELEYSSHSIMAGIRYEF